MTYTEQELFDKVLGHLAQQKVKSAVFNEPTTLHSEGNWSCLYRGPNNTQCAFGVLIPDAAYTPFLEGWLHVQNASKRGGAKGCGRGFG